MFSETTFTDEERQLKAKFKFSDYKTWMPKNPEDRNRYDAALEQLKSEYYRVKGRYTVDGVFDTDAAAKELAAFRATLIGPTDTDPSPMNDGDDGDSTASQNAPDDPNTTNRGDFDGINVKETKEN
jgi:hypothetical protein